MADAPARTELDKWGSRLWEDLRALDAADSNAVFIDKAVSTIADLEAVIVHLRGALNRRLTTEPVVKETL